MEGPFLIAGLALGIAGIVKGTVGLGLPLVAMGLMALVLPPVEAAALVVLPAIITNIWQALVGPAFLMLLRRLWPAFLAIAVTILLFRPLIVATPQGIGLAMIGGLVVIYAGLGLAGKRFRIPVTQQRRFGVIAGALSGAATAATGVFSVPIAPYLQSIGLNRHELVQAMGIAFSLSSLSLTANLGALGALHVQSLPAMLVGTASAVIGMFVGAQLRKRLDEELFRKVLMSLLLLLGCWLMARGAWILIG